MVVNPAEYPSLCRPLYPQKRSFTEVNGMELTVSSPVLVEKMKHGSLHRNSRMTVIHLVTALIVLWGNAAMTMTLNSPAFQQNDHIPSKYTCEGEDVSPPLTWERVPNGAKSLVLSMILTRPIRKPPRWFGYIGSSTTSRRLILAPAAQDEPSYCGSLSR